ncbi:MAG: VIT1/CCC1 transporter family protein [Patescibacteria group bacterium]|nr:VIT1/CCC1 transporter family protein [Patescibacteria group bacterium]MDE1944318.1 VIT1/CCC1 transporter family protein [Patescibacteria group bacterium]MDE1945097.1 VIT1/CCC1 transporter family protein [Patescibacteria group bacterium]MDE2057607.1 VIT1/CCC1 transporter family protein [Patescibacteria group bacterium]
MNSTGRFGLYLRSIVFGVVDSLVSTVGLLAGLDVAGASHAVLAFTGGIYAVVEAFSMAVGNFLSEESVEEYAKRGDVSERAPILAGIVMFAAFMVAALIPLAPYLLLGDPAALATSVILSVIALFVVGALSARIAKVPALSRGLRMAVLGGSAILIGVIVGYFFPTAG